MGRIIARLPSRGLVADLMQGEFFDGERRTVRRSYSQPDTVVIDATDKDYKRLEMLGAKIFHDVTFRVLPGTDDDPNDLSGSWTPATPNFGADGSLFDVIAQIGAPDAWRRSRGRGVTVAVVDTGVAPGLREIPPNRRSPVDLNTVYSGQHWNDTQGHGSMCAAIAGGSSDQGGRYDGVAPEATILSARTDFSSSDLLDIYDELLRARALGQLSGPLVVTNSYGLYTCSPPDVLPQDHPYFRAVLQTIAQGVFVCFAAGNNHYKDVCGHNPHSCGPNTIWGPNSHDEIVSVGTVNRDLTNCDPLTPHANSSRGPGEWAQNHKKPDCVAPTYGEVPWGATYRQMNWWGTSGACPQVAGLAALILSLAPTLLPAQIAGIIRETCSILPEGRDCVGQGLIDCVAAVDRAATIGSGAA